MSRSSSDRAPLAYGKSFRLIQTFPIRPCTDKYRFLCYLLQEMQKKTFITKAEAARKCGLSRLAVYSLIDLGIIEVDHKGRIFRAPFMAWLSNRTGASSDDE